MKRINVKLLLILVLSSGALLIGIYFLHDFQARRRADGLLVLAEQKKEEKDYQTEAQMRISYVSRRPGHTEQYGHIAKAYSNLFEEGRKEGKLNPKLFQRAFAFYEKGVRSAPENVELRKSAIDFFIRMYRFKDAISHLEYLKRQQDGKLEPELEAQLATCYLRSGQEDRASEMLASMIGYDPITKKFDDERATAPNSIDAHRMLAAIYARDRRMDVAKTIMDKLIERNPDSAHAYLARGRQFYESDRETARLDFQKALEIDGENEEILLAAGQVALDAGDLDQAAELYERSVQLFPDSVMTLRGLSLIAISRNQTDKAMEYLDRGIAVSPYNPDLFVLRADFQLRSGDLDGVDETIAQLRELNVPRFFRDYLWGRLHDAKGEWFKAVSKLTEARPHIEQSRPQLLDQVDVLLARCYENLGQHDRRLSAMTRVLERNPTNVQYRWLKIQAQLALKQIDQALEEYDSLDRQLSQLSSRSETLLIQHLQMELMQQGRLPEGERDFQEAAALVKQVIAAKRINTSVKTTTLASYFELIGEMDKAEQLMRKLRESSPNNLALVLGRIKERAYQEDGFADAMQELDELVESAGDAVPFRLLRAELLASKRPEGYKQKLMQLAEDVDGYNDNNKFLLWTELGKYQAALGNYQETLRLWNLAKPTSPDNIDLLMKIYDVALLSEDELVIRTALDDLRALAGEDSAVWKWARAARIAIEVRNGGLPRSELTNAQGLVDEAVKARGGWEQLYRLRGEIASLQGRQDVAMTAYQQAIDLGSTNVGLHRKLARLYYAREMLSEAESVLKRLPPSSWTKLERRIHLDVLSRQGKLPEEVPYDEESPDPTDHVFVSQLFAKAGRFDESEAAMARAINIAPESPGTWGARIRYLVLRDQREEAREVLETASARVPDDERPTFMASALTMLGDWEQAAKFYQASIDQEPGNAQLKMSLANVLLRANKRDEAKQVLQEIIETDSGEFSKPIIALARRTLAEVIAGAGTYESYKQAVALIDKNEERLGVLTNDDLILRAKIAASRVEQATRREAVEKLESIQAGRKLVDRAKFIMAELYHGLHDWSAAQSLMLDMLSRNPSDPVLLERWLTWLIERDDMRQAAKWVENADPRSAIYTRTKVLVDASNGRSDRALARLKSLVPKTLDESTLPFLRTIAMLTEEVGKYDRTAYDEAEAMWKRYVKAKREAVLELALHYKRRDDPAKAVDGLKVCHVARKMGQGTLAIQTAIELLRNYQGRLKSQEQYEATIVKWIDAELEEHPELGLLYIQRSELADLLGNSQESIEWMRRFLEKENLVPVQKATASNNLAFRLALEDEVEEAQQLLDDALRFFGPRPELRDTQGVIHYSRKEFPEAVEQFTLALNEGEPSATTYLHLALASYEIDDKVAAESALRSAEELGLDTKPLSKIERELYEELVRDLKRDGFLAPAAPEVDQQAQSAN